MSVTDFTPALGHRWLTPAYDATIALMTREGRWRNALLRQLKPQAGELIVDFGCGTGTFAIKVAQCAPQARVIGIDPDPDVLRRAVAKAQRQHRSIEFREGYATDMAAIVQAPIDKVVSSLVFHQVPMSEKRMALSAIWTMLAVEGELHVADYGLQRTALMRRCFRLVQNLDGFENTTPNAKGVLPELMREAGFAEVAERAVIPTPTGSISLYFGRKTAAGVLP